MNVSSWRPRTVLVIDDDPLMRELLVALLEMEGILVTAAASGEEALAWLAEPGSAPEVVLTDLRMPETNITRLIPKLRESRERGAVLLGMSGSPAADEELALLDGFLLKPFTTEDFFSALAGTMQAEAARGDSKETGSDDETPPLVLDLKVYERMAASMKPAALAELYRIALDDVQQRTDAMRAAYARGDYGACRREAHALKGGCGMVGAMQLRSQAALLEAGAVADTAALEKLKEASGALRRMLDARL